MFHLDWSMGTNTWERYVLWFSLMRVLEMKHQLLMHSEELCLFAFRYDPSAKRIAGFSILSSASLRKFVTHCCDFVCSHTCTSLSVRKSNVIISVCMHESTNLFKIELQEIEESTRQRKLFLPFYKQTCLKPQLLERSVFSREICQKKRRCIQGQVFKI